MVRPLYTPGDRLRATRDNVRDPSIDLARYEGLSPSESFAAQVADLIPGEWHYFINDAEVTQAEYEAAQIAYRRHRDADGTSPEAVENIARWVRAGLTDDQFEAEYVRIYGPVDADRSLFDATRTRFRVARG